MSVPKNTAHLTKRGWAVLVLATFALTTWIAVQATSANADTTFPYEVTVVWQMDNPDLSNPTSYEWPQRRVAGIAAAACEGAKYQTDTYTIQGKDDQDYLAGLTVLNSPADDASLSPHNYFATVVPADKSLCESPSPSPSPSPSTSTSSSSSSSHSSPPASIPSKSIPSKQTSRHTTKRSAVVPPISTQKAPPTKQLAYTGGMTRPVQVIGILGALSVLAGLYLIFGLRRIGGKH